MLSFRSKETQEKYIAFREQKKRDGSTACRFCDEVSPDEKRVFRYWKILHNEFPYDEVATKHDMVIPKRHFVNEDEMTDDERAELTEIKTKILPGRKEYDSIMENFMRTRSMEHYHIHLLKFKT